METFLEWFMYLFLGIFQGVTEPLPISSSGHLMMLRALFNIPAVDFFFEVVLHFASFLAIAYLFRQKLTELVVGSFRFVFKKDLKAREEFEYVLKIALAAIPAGLIGFFFKGFIETNILTLGLLPIGLALWVTAFFLFLVQRLSIENHETEIGYKDAFTIGLFQVVALLPGISRSGSTLVGGFLRKIELKALIEFSFILYLPIAFFSMVLELTSVSSNTHPIGPLVGSFIFSGLFTYWALKWFIGLVQKGYLKYFGFYCVLAGLFALILHFSGF